MTPPLRVYLAGPITGKSYGGATEWRDEFPKLVAPHVHCLSPMRAKYHLAELEEIEDTVEHPIFTDNAVVHRDRWDVARADVVVFNLADAARVSIGTMVEYGWATAHGVSPKVLITVTGSKPRWMANPHYHLFPKTLSTYVVETLEDAADLVNIL